ncbi:hypothetical protein BS78_05G267000 [Paspalum vaginatum]|nr:hypothetical protein BS78_05G267000 [Paspalum vaginatum]
MEGAVSVSLGVVRSLPGKLERLLSPESGGNRPLLKAEKNKIRLLKDHLQELIDKYLIEPSAVEAPTSTARCWVKEVRELSYDIDDFLDELIYRLYGGGAANQRNLQGKVARLREGLTRSRWVADETSRFRARLEEAIQRHKRYNLEKLQSRPNRIDTEDEDEPPIRVKAARLVGIDSSMKTLEEWLTGDGERRLRVVSIVGFGGIGKTTLAKELYCKLGWQFECRAFARSSQKPDISRLLTSILLQIRRHQLPSDLELGNLTDTIRAYLQDKKYFIIVDDLWDASLWDIIHHALPDDKCCSRVLTTTEIGILAQRCCGHSSKHIFNMEPLCDKGSSELFFSRFSVNQSGNCEEFSKILSEIIRKCGGFPLATIATASILGRQQGKIEHYNLISRSLSMNLRANPTIEGMKQVLSLCYDNLPGRLKACMLYLSIYKEGQTIWKTDLVKQWITEGFICEKQGKHMEEVAGSYFDELANAGMIQPVDIKYNGEVLSCTVHYMVLNVIRYRSIEENFVTAIDFSQTNTSLADKVRRLSLHFGHVDDVESPAKLRMTQVRSLVFYGFFKSLPSIAEFRFLRVLIIHLWGDRDNINLDLTTVCNFFRLRNLNIACNVTLNLQIKLQGLEYLEILKIDSRVTEVPQEIVLLPSLLHLSLPGDTNLPNGIGHMASLHTLGCFDLSSNSADNVRSLGMLRNVRDLRLTCSTIQCDNLLDNVACLASVLSKLSNLKSLNLSPVVCSSSNTLEASAPSIIISFDGLSRVSSPPALLEQLEFSPRICIFSRFPWWIGELGKLSIIKVATRELWQGDIDILSRLNALSALSLYVRTAPTERIIFHKEDFAVLIYFKFTCSSPCLAFKKEAMPNVRRLKISFTAKTLEQCSRDVVGAGFENLTGLEVLSVKIGGAGSDESVRETVESVLEHAFGKRGGNPIINVQLVDRISVVAQKEQHQTLERPDVITKMDSEGQCTIGELGLTEDTKIRGDDRSRITLSLESSAHMENPGNFINADRSDVGKVTRSNAIVSGRESRICKPFASDYDTLARHKLPSLDKELTVKDPNSYLMDPETKDLYIKARSQEQEILLLRKKLVYALDNELQLLREKHILERRLQDLKMAADERQEETISGALKQLSQKKEHLEEKRKLEGDLKIEVEELYLFTSSLLSMLAEYNVYPPQLNASTITTCMKRSYHQMQRRLSFINGDLVREFANNGNKITSDDPLPGIEGFQIVGEPRLGFTLTACGYPTNGTTLCTFQWVRYHDDGTKQSIEGATMYDYVVTADDVDTLLSVHCTPEDDNGRQGVLVRKFANDGNKISYDPDVKNVIDSYISNGRADFEISVQMVNSSDDWEPATLVLIQPGYHIKLKRTGEKVIEEKYSPNLLIKIPNGRATHCVLVSSGGVNLRFTTVGIREPNNEDYNFRLQNIIILVMRTFQNSLVQTTDSHQSVSNVEMPSIAGQWVKTRLIANGTFGCVYEATNRHSGALCAMKEINVIPYDAKSHEYLNQLEQNIKSLCQFKHENIVQYYGSETIDGTFYICLEYVNPGSIEKYIQQHCGLLSESVIRNFMPHILKGLAFLHSQKIMHRDIKAANLLVDGNGVVKLADFGLAKHLSNAPNHPLRGTPYWMAPEVVRATLDKSACYDLAVDIWSLGCTIIEMFTGKPPWSNLEGPAAMFKVLRVDPPIPDSMSPEGKDFLRLCFRRNPAERPTASSLLGHPFVQSSTEDTARDEMSSWQNVSFSRAQHGKDARPSASEISSGRPPLHLHNEVASAAHHHVIESHNMQPFNNASSWRGPLSGR